MLYILALLLAALLQICDTQSSTINIKVEEYNGADKSENYFLKFLINNAAVVNLNLTRNDLLHSNIKVMLGLDTNRTSNVTSFNVWDGSKPNEFIAYQDRSYGAAFLKFPDSSIQGTFRYGTKEFFIQPGSAKKRRRRKRSVTQYTAKEVQPNTLHAPPDTLIKDKVVESSKLTNYLNSAKDAKRDYISEIVMLVDYSLYKNWYDQSSTSLSADERKKQTINTIRYYYANIANSMDLRYSNIKEKDFSISIKLNGIFIASTAQASPWTENYLINVQNNMVLDTYGAIDHLPTWLDANTNMFPQWDNLLVLTDYSMYAGNYDNGQPKFISGLANIQAICSSQAVSFSRENGEFATTGTTTHELAHNLGSYHDTLSDNSCDPNDQYIMSPAPGQLNNKTFMHPFFFSACSIDNFRTYLGFKGAAQANCLLQTSADQLQPGDVPPNTPMGQYIKVDRQCQLLFGIESFYCGGMDLDQKMCSMLYCYDPLSNQCTSRTEYRAFQGTTCGDKKWCSQGSCVYNSAAPAASDVCLSGDSRDPAVNCRQLLANDFSKCYDANYYMRCCATCAYFKKSDPTCPFGDQQPSYCQTLKPSSCYETSMQKICCQSCKDWKKTTIPNCEYGDKADWCTPLSSPSACYASESTCCLSCAYNKMPLSGCEYGDKATWCSTVSQAQCSQVADQCCVKCNSKYSSMVPSLQKNINVVTLAPPVVKNRFEAVCRDDKTWCLNLAPFACYDVTVSNACPCACQSMRVSGLTAGCDYGDKYTWCRNLTRDGCQNLADPGFCCQYCPSISGGSSMRIEFSLLLGSLFALLSNCLFISSD